MFDVYGSLKPRGKRSTLRSYWSVQIHATRKQLTAHEREVAYIVKGEVLPPSLEIKICHRIARLIWTLSRYFMRFFLFCLKMCEYEKIKALFLKLHQD